MGSPMSDVWGWDRGRVVLCLMSGRDGEARAKARGTCTMRSNAS